MCKSCDIFEALTWQIVASKYVEYGTLGDESACLMQGRP